MLRSSGQAAASAAAPPAPRLHLLNTPHTHILKALNNKQGTEIVDTAKDEDIAKQIDLANKLHILNSKSNNEVTDTSYKVQDIDVNNDDKTIKRNNLFIGNRVESGNN